MMPAAFKPDWSRLMFAVLGAALTEVLRWIGG